MENQKSIKETLSKEKLKEIDAMISDTKNPIVKYLMKRMLLMSFEELKVLENEIKKGIE